MTNAHDLCPAYSLRWLLPAPFTAFRNTFGFYYWLLVFCCKAILYLMILTVVFIQTDNLQVDLTWLFISIMGVAAVFLWCEIVQFFKQGLAYTL